MFVSEKRCTNNRYIAQSKTEKGDSCIAIVKDNFKLPFYEDVNIIFDKRGRGKTEILESLKKYYIEKWNCNGKLQRQ